MQRLLLHHATFAARVRRSTLRVLRRRALPLDAWDQFVKDAKGMDDAIKIQQAALERYNKRA